MNSSKVQTRRTRGPGKIEYVVAHLEFDRLDAHDAGERLEPWPPAL
jgi:hypothetical protein